MVIKVLFLDTNAIIKYFIDELGSDVVRWLFNSDTRMMLGLTYTTSKHVEGEFYSVIEKKVNNGSLTLEKANRIRRLAETYFKQSFNIRDNKPIPNYRFGENADEHLIIERYNLNPRRDSGDAKIISCVINYLRGLAGASLPHVITSDIRFQRIIISEGYRFIDPENQSKEQIEEYFISISR